MNKPLAILLVLAITAPVFAENFSPQTNGYRWLEYSNEEKLLYVAFIYNKFNIDNNKYPSKKIIATLGHLYDLKLKDEKDDAKDKFLILPCIVVLSGFIDALKEEAEKYRIKKPQSSGNLPK